MATHRELVTSPLVIQNAIEHLLPQHKIDLENDPPSDWNELLAENLSASTIRRTNFIQVHYRSLSPEAAAAVVSAIVQSYLEFVENTHKGTASDVLANLTQELDNVKQTLAAKQGELQSVRQQYGALTVRTADGIIHPTIQKASGSERVFDDRATTTIGARKSIGDASSCNSQRCRFAAVSSRVRGRRRPTIDDFRFGADAGRFEPDQGTTTEVVRCSNRAEIAGTVLWGGPP